VVLWAALTFPTLSAEQAAPFEQRLEMADTQLSAVNMEAEALKQRLETLETQYTPEAIAERVAAIAKVKELAARSLELEEEKSAAQHELESAETRNTIGGRFGLFVEPFFAPLGFDWRTDVALLAGVAAKEAVLSTMGTAYSIGEVDPEEAESLGERLASDPGWSKTTALALMLFVLIYSPCFVTLVVLKNEAGGWRWLFFSMIFNTGLAYGIAYIGTLVGRVLWG
jgi:ferrous iron transport protein B